MDEVIHQWKQGMATTEQVIDLAADLGNRHYNAGIPILLQLLKHSNAIVRYNAVMSLAFEFHHMEAVEPLLNMLANDEDEECRDVAAGGLGNLCQDTRDRRVLEALAESVLSDSDEGVRRSAYKALEIVNGVSRDEHLRLLRDRELRVDPQRVRCILQQPEK